MAAFNLSFTGGLAPAGALATASGQLGGMEIFCWSVWILTAVGLGEGSSGSRLSCCTCFGRKQARLSWPRARHREAGSPAGGSLYLQLRVLWRLCKGLIRGGVWVCREGLHRKVLLGRCRGGGPGLRPAAAMQEGLDGREVQVYSVGVGLARSICRRGSFLGGFHLHRKESGGSHCL